MAGKGFSVAFFFLTVLNKAIIFLKKSLAIAFYYELASSNQPAVFPGNFQADIMLFIRAMAMNFNIVEDKM